MVIALSSFAFGISLSPLISLIAGILILIYAAPAQLYRGNLPHYHWLGRRVQPVRTLLAIKTTLRSPRPLNAPHSRKVSPPKRTNGSKMAAVVNVRKSKPGKTL